MAEISQNIFREYDIRGIAEGGKELDPEKAYLIGKAVATYLYGRGENKLIVGKDNRLTSDEFTEHLVKGIIETGLDVIEIGLVTSPISYYAAKTLGLGSVMVTASHNPKEYNGFKITSKESGSLHGGQLQEIYQIIKEEAFQDADEVGSIEQHDIVTPYKEMLKEKIQLDKPLKVVVDCGNGATSPFAQEIFEGWGCEVIADYCVPDGNFPNHSADPVKVDNAKILAESVAKHNADIGIGFDGDGDRLGLVDNEGNMIFGDMLMVLFYKEVLETYPGMTCLIEVKCSQALYEMTERFGGKPRFSPTGHSLVKALMKETEAKFAGEMSGHMFFADEYYGYDDAFYAAGRILRILSKTDKSFAELLSDVPKYISTPEVRVTTTDEAKFDIVKQAAEKLKTEWDVVDVDGARVNFPFGGWGLIRASNTQPAIVVRAEAKNDEDLEKIKQVIEAELLQHESITHIDWSGKEG